MKNFFLVLLLSLLFYTCTSPVSPPPPGLLSDQKMVSILIDLHVAEAKVERLGVMTDSGAIYYKNLQKAVFKKHKITEKEFFKNYDYYLVNVSELDKIYEKVIDSLSMREVNFNKSLDSLRRLE